MRIPLLAWVFQGIPESIGLAALVFSMCAKEFEWKYVIRIGLIQAVLCYFIRLMPFSPYSHVFILLTTQAVLFSVFTDIDIRVTYICCAIAVFILLCYEGVFLHLFDMTGVLTLEETVYNATKRIITGIPQVMLLFLTAGVILWSRKYLYERMKSGI